MVDLFDREQQIYESAIKRIREINDSAELDPIEYKKLASEYGRLLRQLRKITKISDKTTVNLYASKLDLFGKVNYDALTGIYNRRYMEENLKRSLKTVSRSGSSPGGMLGVLMIDVDCFKKYNDTYGHDMGDICLKSVAEALNKSILRPDDFVARYGGEEFIVVLPNTDENGVHVMAERMLESVRALGIPHKKNEAADYVTISIGGTTGYVLYTCDSGGFIKKADKALYMSKLNGRNKYTFIKLEEDAQ